MYNTQHCFPPSLFFFIKNSQTTSNIFSCKMPGNYEKDLESGSSSSNMSNVNEEYMETFRTKSYVEIFNKVQNHLGIRKDHDDDDDNHVGPSSSSSSLSSISIHFNGAPLNQMPRQQETLVVDMINASSYHPLVMDYFKVGFEACKICEQLLQVVLQTRENHRIIKRVIKIGKRVYECTNIDFRNQSKVNVIVEDLALYSLHKNPLSSFSRVKFNNTQDGHDLLFKKLKSKYGKTRRRMKFIRRFKKFLGFTLVVSCTALTTAMLILAFHSLVGIMTSPVLVGCCLGLIKKRKKMAKKVLKTDELERLGAQIDVAARGVYTLINDFDTMSRLGRRLYDEIEHGKVIADICVRNGKGEVLKEVVREFERHEGCFLELLEEFEEHIYLCLLNINRSKIQLVEGIIVLHSPSE